MAGTSIFGSLLGLTKEELLELRTNALAALNGTLITGQAYSRPGFSFTKMSPDQILQLLKEVEYALSSLDGSFINTTYPEMSDSLP